MLTGRGVFQTRDGRRATVYGQSYYDDRRFEGHIGKNEHTLSWLADGRRSESVETAEDLVGVWG